jgi:WD40 repeat protein
MQKQPEKKSTEVTLLPTTKTCKCKLIRVLEGHTDKVISVTFRPDGRLLASGSGDQTIRLWIHARVSRMGNP